MLQFHLNPAICCDPAITAPLELGGPTGPQLLSRASSCIPDAQYGITLRTFSLSDPGAGLDPTTPSGAWHCVRCKNR